MKIKSNEKYEFYSIQLQCHSTSHSTQPMDGPNRCPSLVNHIRTAEGDCETPVTAPVPVLPVDDAWLLYSLAGGAGACDVGGLAASCDDAVSLTDEH